MTQDNTSEWIPIMEACKRLNISHHVVKRLIKEGRLETKKDIMDTRSKLIDISVLERLLKRS